MYHTALVYTILYYTMLYCTVLYYGKFEDPDFVPGTSAWGIPEKLDAKMKVCIYMHIIYLKQTIYKNIFLIHNSHIDLTTIK